MKERITYWLAIAGLVLLTVFLGAAICSAQTYVTRNGVLYSVTYQTYTSRYCGRSYCYKKPVYTAVLSVKDKDWRSKGLDIIYHAKEAQAFQEFVGTIGAQNILGGYAYQQQQQALYPSATGSSYGGFTQVEVARFGVTAPYDVNRAQSEVNVLTDNYVRAAADAERRATETRVASSGLIQLTQQGAVAIAEKQEDRALLEQARGVIDQARQIVKESLQGQAALLQAGKPSPQESIHYNSGQQGSTEPPPPPVPPDALPQQGPPLNDYNNFCGACHGAESQSPAGGWEFTGTGSIDKLTWAEITLRINPNAPAWHEVERDGKKVKVPFRMPPENADEQPTPEQRSKITIDLQPYVKLSQ